MSTTCNNILSLLRTLTMNPDFTSLRCGRPGSNVVVYRVCVPRSCRVKLAAIEVCRRVGGKSEIVDLAGSNRSGRHGILVPMGVQ